MSDGVKGKSEEEEDSCKEFLKKKSLVPNSKRMTWKKGVLPFKDERVAALKVNSVEVVLHCLESKK